MGFFLRKQTWLLIKDFWQNWDKAVIWVISWINLQILKYLSSATEKDL